MNHHTGLSVIGCRSQGGRPSSELEMHQVLWDRAGPGAPGEELDETSTRTQAVKIIDCILKFLFSYGQWTAAYPAEVQRHPDVGDETCCPTWKPAERVVTMETRRKEEERWRKVCPEMKKCVVLIRRLEKLLKPKQEADPRPKTEHSYCCGAIVTDTLTGQSKCAG